jgi:hypothetical protein
VCLERGEAVCLVRLHVAVSVSACVCVCVRARALSLSLSHTHLANGDSHEERSKNFALDVRRGSVVDEARRNALEARLPDPRHYSRNNQGLCVPVRVGAACERSPSKCARASVCARERVSVGSCGL